MDYNSQLSSDYSDLKDRYARLKDVSIYYQEEIKRLREENTSLREKLEKVEYPAYTAVLENLCVEHGLVKRQKRLCNRKYVTEKAYNKLKGRMEYFIKLFWEAKDELNTLKNRI